MNKHLQILLLVAVLWLGNTAFLHAQGIVSGKILNQKDKQPIDYASVAVKKLSADSSVVGSTSTSANGSFSIGNIAVGKYRLYVVFLGLKTINRDFELTTAKPSVNFGDLLMEDTGVTLKGVEIKGETPPIVVKKDTLEINASTLKVKENSVVEDLLKKVPGVEVSKDGTVTTQGETIKRVKVDGKDFMGNDPLLATRNLPADMVDKIQIIDEMSEQSKFSGVDDGNREKILNIVTKNGIKNKGYIGNSTVGYGTDERHDVNINVNRFDNAQRISLIGQFNNVNKQNFGGGIGGGGRGMMFGGAGGGQQQQGITTTSAAGIDFADTYDDGTQFNGSYFFNKTSLFNTSATNSQSFIGNEVASSFDNTESNTKRLNHRLNFMVDTKLDSATSIRIQPNISYTDNSGNSLKDYEQNTVAGREVGYQRSITGSTAPSISNNLLLRRKFLRRGRTLSLNVSTNINDSDASNFNRNPWTLTRPTGVTTENLDQLNDNKVNSFSNTARLVYTEPLSKTLSLELNYQNGYSKDNRERFVYDFNSVTQQYDIVDLKYSNEFENTTLTNALGFSFNKNEKKYNWNVGLAALHTNRKNDNLTTGRLLTQEFVNITPTAQFRYNFSNAKRLNIRYDGRTNQPSIDQIQPVRDNTNTRSIPLGNPDLKPSFSNNLRIFYNNFDYTTYRTLFLGAFITQTFNDFGNTQRVITDATSDDFGKIENGFINVKGNYNVSLFGNLGLPIIKGNKLNLQIDGGVSASKGTNITAGQENVTKNLGLRNGYKLVSNLDKLDLIAGVSGRWDHGTYTIGQETNFYTLSPNIDISYMFPGNIRLQTDVTYNSLTGRGAANADYTQVNAYISRQFFKNKGTFKLSVNDLFNENTGVVRTANANEIVDRNFNVLKRYFMFSFTYALSSIAGMQMPNQQQGRGQGNFRMGGPGRM